MRLRAAFDGIYKIPKNSKDYISDRLVYGKMHFISPLNGIGCYSDIVTVIPDSDWAPPLIGVVGAIDKSVMERKYAQVQIPE